jgi:alpha-beta hydrolase superfamily lysophospholipase
VLYVHGWVDYFFQTHLAKAVEQRGYRFYAVDLRGYGRSIGRSGNHALPNYTSDLSVYAKDLDAAAKFIAQEEGHSRLVLMCHSTGGLIGPLWATTRPGRLAAMVLNSPWLDLNENWMMRFPVTWLIDVLGRIKPYGSFPTDRPFYGMALHQSTGGEWDYNLEWKPNQGFPIRFGWLREIRRAHRRVARGLQVDCPVLVATSAKRGDNHHDHANVLTTDSILDPAQMWRRGKRLGPQVEFIKIAGGAHDLALSPQPARSQYLTSMLDWLDTTISAVDAAPTQNNNRSEVV